MVQLFHSRFGNRYWYYNENIQSAPFKINLFHYIITKHITHEKICITRGSNSPHLIQKINTLLNLSFGEANYSLLDDNQGQANKCSVESRLLLMLRAMIWVVNTSREVTFVA